jgi:hypothetical protein
MGLDHVLVEKHVVVCGDQTIPVECRVCRFWPDTEQVIAPHVGGNTCILCRIAEHASFLTLRELDTVVREVFCHSDIRSLVGLKEGFPLYTHRPQTSDVVKSTFDRHQAGPQGKRLSGNRRCPCPRTGTVAHSLR